MLYSVKYKQPGWWFWRTLKNVKGDGIMFGQNGQCVPVRYFVLMDESRVEFPMDMIFRFGPERFQIIESNIRKESGH